ncbi:MAG: DUF2157 domain-containing protein [Magnetococcales bacterium]|nr:DUF2157 domain-containing protein [Magnetococcales bacterium]
MAHIERRLKEWVQAGLIAADQAEAILRHEGAHSGKNWLLFSFLSLGAGVVGIGIISLVAANWDEIPDAVKLGADLLTLVALALGIWKRRDHSQSLTWELLLIFFALALLTSIGLIGQVFHSGGSWDQALLLWVAITLPLATLTCRSFLPLAWTFALLVAGSYRLILTPIAAITEEERGLLIGYLLPLACALVALLLHLWRATESLGRAFLVHSWIVGITMVMLIDVSSMNPVHTWEWYPFMTGGGLALGGVTLAGIVLNGHGSPLSKKLLGSLVTLYSLMGPMVIGLHLSHWLSALFTMALFSLAAAWMVRERSVRMANGMVLLLGIRFLVLFFTAFGGLFDAGIGLILSGLIILGFVWLWSRWQRMLLSWFQGMAPS